MKSTIVFCTVSSLILVLLESEGAQPSGLKSLRQCNRYNNLDISDKKFSALTIQELDKLNKDELDYTGAFIIVHGGVNALPNQLPFVAALGFMDGSSKVFVCGGTLISELFVLTAAHCIYTRTQRIEFVRLGDLNLSSSADDTGAQEFQVGDFFIHPNYKYPYKYNDIALIKLDRPAVFTSSVSPACLEPKRVDIRFKDFYVAGWGRLDFGEDTSDHLQVAKLEHYSVKECQKMFPKDHSLPDSIKVESQICAIGGGPNLTDTCEGDSGGPLAYKYDTSPKTFVYMIAGITSFGKPCAIDEIPGIYTRVSYYTDWIERIIWPVDDDSSEISDDDKIYFPED